MKGAAGVKVKTKTWEKELKSLHNAQKKCKKLKVFD